MLYIRHNRCCVETFYDQNKVYKSFYRGGQCRKIKNNNLLGELELLYEDGTCKTLSGVKCDVSNGFPYGVAVSPNGSAFYVPDDEEHGLCAYSVDDGRLLWESTVKNCGRMITFENSILVHSNHQCIMKLDALTGEVRGVLDTRAGDHFFFDVSPQYCLAVMPDRKFAFIDKRNLTPSYSFHAESLLERPIVDVILLKAALYVLEYREIDDGESEHFSFSYRMFVPLNIGRDVKYHAVNQRINILHEALGLSFSYLPCWSEEALATERKKDKRLKDEPLL